MVKRSINQKLRLRNFDARRGRIESEGGKGICYQWKEKGKCSKGDQCSFWRESTDRAKPTPKAATPSEPSLSRGRSVLRKKVVSVAKVTTVPFFDNRADTVWKELARDGFVTIGILPNVNSVKQNRAVKQGISVCSRTTRLTNNQTKAQTELPFPQRKRKRKQKCCSYCEKLYHNWVASRKTRMRWFLKGANGSGETRCKKSWDQFEK